MSVVTDERPPLTTPALWWLSRIAWGLFFANVLAFFLTPFLIWFEAGGWVLLGMFLVGPLLTLIALGIAIARRDRVYLTANLIVVVAYAAWWGVMYIVVRPAG